MSEIQSSLKEIYRRRFGEDFDFRNRMYRTLCEDFFQKFVPPESTIVDIASGYCEFINNINAAKKIALDINPDSEKFAAKEVEWRPLRCSDMRAVADQSADVVFASNILEHLTKDEIVKTIQEARRVLKEGGKFLILQPNIRYCYKDYWMFFDHITPLDDRSLCEILQVHGFEISECRPRFLPYTTKGRLPKSIFLLKLYLKIPLAQRLFGQQAFVCAVKARS